MTCQKFTHVGELFPFPRGWSGATGAAQRLDGASRSDDNMLHCRGVRASVRRKQSLLASLESCARLGFCRQSLPGSDPVDENTSLPQASGLTPGVRSALVERRRMSGVAGGTLKAAAPLLASYMRGARSTFTFRQGGTYSRTKYYPPGNGPLDAGYTALDTDVVDLDDADAVAQLAQGTADLYEATPPAGYAGFEDYTTWPRLSAARGAGDPPHPKLELWTDVDEFLGLGEDDGIAAAVRSTLYNCSPWYERMTGGDLSDVDSLAASRGMPPDAFAELARLGPRRLASATQALFEQVASDARSLERSVQGPARIPHYSGEMHASVVIGASYDPDSSGDGKPVVPEFSLVQNSLTATGRTTYRWGLAYDLDLDYDGGATSPHFARTQYVDAEALSIDFAGKGIGGRRTIGGQQYWVLTAEEFLGAARAEGYHTAWSEGTPDSPGTFSVSVNLGFTGPSETPDDDEIEAADDIPDPSQAVQWAMQQPRLCAVIARGTVSGRAVGNISNFMASASQENTDDPVPPVRTIDAKIKDGVIAETGLAPGIFSLPSGWVESSFALKNILGKVRDSFVPGPLIQSSYLQNVRFPLGGHGGVQFQSPTASTINDGWYTPEQVRPEDLSQQHDWVAIGDCYIDGSFDTSIVGDIAGDPTEWLSMPAVLQSALWDSPMSLHIAADLLGIWSYEARAYDDQA